MNQEVLEKNNNTIELSYQEVPLYKRFFAGLIDLFSTILLTIILVLLSLLVYQETSFYKTSINNIENVCLESKLFVKQNSDLIAISSYYSLDNKDLTNEVKKKELSERANYFYIELNSYSEKENEGRDILNSFIEEYGLDYFVFDKENNIYIEKEDVLDGDFIKFYTYLIDNNALAYLTQSSIYLKESINIFIVQLLIVLISFIVSILVFYLLFPLIFKRGNKSLGKLIFRFGSLNEKGLCLTKKDFFIKFLWFFLIEVILSIFTIGIPFIFSVGMMFISKNKQNFNEYMSKTYSLMNESNKFYLDYEEYYFEKKKNSN